MASSPRPWAIGAAVVVLAGSAAGAAGAHPFGPPLTATTAVAGSTVNVAWTGAADDWVALGEWTGAFAGNPDPTRTGVDVIMESADVRDYLLEHIAVSQHGDPCPPTWLGIEDLADAGAQVSFDCPEPVAVVDLKVTALTDLNEAYRTVVTAGDNQTLFTATTPVQTLDLTAASADNGVLLAASAGGVVLVLGAAWAVIARRRKGTAESTS